MPMSYRLLAGCALLVCAVAPFIAQAQDVLTLTYNDRPPYIVALPDGSAAGLTATPAANAFKGAGIPIAWKKVPTNRQLAEIRENSSRQCAIGWFKNPEREQYAKFTKAIYRDRPTVLIANRQFSTQPNETLQSILAHKLGRVLVKDKFSYGAYIDGLLASSRPETVVTTNENIQMVEMIRIGRADFMFAAEEEARYLIEQAGFKVHDFKVVRLPDVPPGERRYIICSKMVEDDVITRLNAVIDAE
jgi:polar amino acid transport system substrate-binding protein